METLQKPNFKELKEQYSDCKFFEIETLLKTVYRLNAEIMEDCNRMHKVAKGEDEFQRSDKEVSDILYRNTENTQEITFEIDMILKVINEKLEPLKDVEYKFYEIEDYLKNN